MTPDTLKQVREMAEVTPHGNTTRPATEEEAQRGLNDIWPGDPMPTPIIGQVREIPWRFDWSPNLISIQEIFDGEKWVGVYTEEYFYIMRKVIEK